MPLWNQRFGCEPQLAGDAHRRVPAGTNLDSVLSIRESRTVAPDYTVRWDGAMYQVEREQIARGMRGARVPLERRLDGSTWMQWRNQLLALQRCLPRPQEPIASAGIKSRVVPPKSASEKALARQRILEGRRKWQQAYDQLPNRPIWQVLKPPPGRLL